MLAPPPVAEYQHEPWKKATSTLKPKSWNGTPRETRYGNVIALAVVPFAEITAPNWLCGGAEPFGLPNFDG